MTASPRPEFFSPASFRQVGRLLASGETSSDVPRIGGQAATGADIKSLRFLLKRKARGAGELRDPSPGGGGTTFHKLKTPGKRLGRYRAVDDYPRVQLSNSAVSTIFHVTDR
jgi:hypothetical protein